MEKAEFEVGQPVVEVSLMQPGVISAVHAYRSDYGGSVRYSYDLVDGSQGLNANEIDAVVGVQCTSEVSDRPQDGIIERRGGVGKLQLVTDAGDLVEIPSIEFYDLVKAWLKMPKDLIDMSSVRAACP